MVPNQGRPGLRRRLFLIGHDNEPFCTVLLERVSDPIGVSKGQFARQIRRPDLPSRNRAGPDKLPSTPVFFMALQSTTGYVRIGGISFRAGPRRNHLSSEQNRVGWNNAHTPDDWDVSATSPAKRTRLRLHETRT